MSMIPRDDCPNCKAPYRSDTPGWCRSCGFGTTMPMATLDHAIEKYRQALQASRTPAILYLKDKHNDDGSIGMEACFVDTDKTERHFTLTPRLAVLMIEKLANYVARMDAWEREKKSTQKE